jgi:hypothetical protein
MVLQRIDLDAYANGKIAVGKLIFRLLAVSAVFAGLLAFAGCSSSFANPSASDAQKVLETKIQNESQGRIKLVSLQKTNGQTRQIEGVNVYHLEYQADIEFTANCKWVKSFDGSLSLRTTPPPANALMDSDPGPVMQAGQLQTINSAVDFEKTENGWQAQ